jgi:hypothetical protein
MFNALRVKTAFNAKAPRRKELIFMATLEMLTRPLP